MSIKKFFTSRKQKEIEQIKERIARKRKEAERIKERITQKEPTVLTVNFIIKGAE